MVACGRRGIEGVTCGEVQNAEPRVNDGTSSRNDGDGFESRAALAEHLGGPPEIVRTPQTRHGKTMARGWKETA